MRSPLNSTAVTDRLYLELAQIDSDLQLAEQSAATVSRDQSSVGRLARMDAVQRLTTHQRRVSAAIDRVTAGTYGMCCECGDTITAERLQVEPAVLFCPDCQAERQ